VQPAWRVPAARGSGGASAPTGAGPPAPCEKPLAREGERLEVRDGYVEVIGDRETDRSASSEGGDAAFDDEVNQAEWRG
jgi:hypothetical protein